MAVDQGIALVPARPGTKIPLGAWGKGQYTYDVVMAVIDDNARVNLAAVTGPRSGGLLVIDADRHGGPDGVAWLDGWQSARRELPDTVLTVTPHGGLHLWYRLDEHAGARTAHRPDLGIDVLYGGLAYLPPSAVGGGEYGYAEGHSPDDVDIAGADDAVTELLAELVRAPSGTGTPDGVPHVVGKGGRHDATFRYACHVRHMGGDGADVLLAATLYNATLCSPHLDDREVREIAGSVCRYPRGENPLAESALMPDIGVPGVVKNGG